MSSPTTRSSSCPHQSDPPPQFDPTTLVGGADTSLASCGITTFGPGGWARSTVFGQSGITKLSLLQRMAAVERQAERAYELLSPGELGMPPALVLIEAPDTSRGYGGLVERIALTYELTRGLQRCGVPVGWVPSPVLKGYATGKGGGKDAKKAVLAAAQQTWPHLGIRKTDQADSAFLAAMAADAMGLGRVVPDQQADEWLYRGAIEYPDSVMRSQLEVV